MTSSPPYNKPDRPAGGPKQYLQGWVEFYKLKFKVTDDVLIPRPETELLVDEVLNSIKYYVLSIKESEILVLDIGTGTGNIAISVARNSKEVKIVAVDVSKRALRIAQQNAKLLNVEDRITFLTSDLLKNPFIHNTLYSILIIVTNLPYIPSARIPYLDSSVKDFEPHVALDGGEDGFDLYRELFSQISTLQPLGFKPRLLIGEIDYTHGELAVNEAQKFFPAAGIEVKTDLAHKQRVLKVTF